jgi:hemoglobin|tara:strand:- start:2716 stop:3129 length:414 start_codon:yes stop_codon:yes gene_type:complete
MTNDQSAYGINDNSYQAAGELSGLINLCDEFYRIMASSAEAKVIYAMHPGDDVLSSKKLAYFLSGWLGGPKLYRENFGAINIPCAHAHLPISTSERDAWIICMRKAAAMQPYTDDFKIYLIEQLKVPAGRILQACGN